MPLSVMIGFADELAGTGKADTILYVGVPGAALLEALRRENDLEGSGEGLLVMRIADVEDVLVGIVGRDRKAVCDARLMTEAEWDRLRFSVFGQVAALSRNSLDL